MSEVTDKITRKIYTNSRMDLDFFMFLPTITPPMSSSGAMSVNYNPVLNLRYKPSKTIKQEFDYSKATYKITPRNIYSVVKFFNNIVKWFYDDKYESLFLLGEDGNIIFNADFKSLSESTKLGTFDNSIMQAVPAVIQYGDKLYEGIHLYVNTTNYCISLTYQEVNAIFDILRNFSFANEVAATLTAYRLAYEYKRFENPRDKFSKTPFDI